MRNTYYQQGNRWQDGMSFGLQTAPLTWAVQKLILITAIVFAAQLLLDIPLGLLVGDGGVPGGVATWLLSFQPKLFLFGMIWRPITYMFLHASLMHLFGNMLWLFFFGPDVEQMMGSRKFVRFYLFCGAVGVLPTLLTPSVTVLGASGAVMGVLVAFAMLNPDRQLFMLPFPVPITARALVIIVLAMNVMSAMAEGTASVLTHLGGMGAAWLYMKFIHSWTPDASQYTSKKNWPFGDEPDDYRKGAGNTDRDEFMDRVGEAVDNILNFDEKKKR